MLQPKQFTQQTLFPGVEPSVVSGAGGPRAHGGPPADRRESSNWRHPGPEFNVRRGPVSTWRTPSQIAADSQRMAARQGVAKRDAELDSGQRAMFMTPREIRSRWQALDGDREDTYHHLSESAGDEWIDDEDEALEGQENDDELFERKLDESMMARSEYARQTHGVRPTVWREGMADRSSAPQPPGGSDARTSAVDRWDQRLGDYLDHKDQPLYDRIASEGVRAPIRLGEDLGLLGKPQVAGGHHRIAAAHDIAPDTDIPVLHDQDITFARLQGDAYGYPYT